jgi:hypothetical protein
MVGSFTPRPALNLSFVFGGCCDRDRNPRRDSSPEALVPFDAQAARD